MQVKYSKELNKHIAIIDEIVGNNPQDNRLIEIAARHLKDYIYDKPMSDTIRVLIRGTYSHFLNEFTVSDLCDFAY